MTPSFEKIQYITHENAEEKSRRWIEELQVFAKRFQPFVGSSSALLVIDMQRYFLDRDSHAFVPSADLVIDRALKLVNAFRSATRPVVFTTFAVEKNESDPIARWWGRSVSTDSSAALLDSRFTPLPAELSIRKNSYSAFHLTELESYLASMNVRQLVIAGVLTNLCCETAAREAFTRNFDIFFTVDATAAYNETMHRASLLNLAYGVATPVTAQSICEAVANV